MLTDENEFNRPHEKNIIIARFAIYHILHNSAEIHDNCKSNVLARERGEGNKERATITQG